nr:craniofacial development protein 2-like [Maniola hyperantus]
MAENNNGMALSPRQTLDGQRVLRISGSAMKIATWNVRSLYSEGKLQNTQQEMCRLHINILGISEVRWAGSGVYTSEQTMLYYSGGNDNSYHRNGVAIMIHKKLHSSVKNFLPVSDRVMLLQVEAKPFNINLIQVYAPTADKDEVLVENFYSDIEIALKQTKKHEITLVMGDFNSKLGRGTVSDIIGPYGLGVRNDRGDRLVQFCQENNFAVSNTYYKLPPRRLYTWRSPADTPENIVRNQIDFILISKRHRNSIKSAKTYPGADVGSDHNPVVVEIKTKLKKIRSPKRSVSMDLSKLRNPDVKKTIKLAMNSELTRLKLENTTNSIALDMEQAWEKLKTSVVSTGKSLLQQQRHVKSADWITDEILSLMDERRENKRNKEKYDQLQREIRKKIREAKEKWLGDLCSEMEGFDKKHDSFNMHKKIKEIIAPKHQGRIMAPLIKDGDGTLPLMSMKNCSCGRLILKSFFTITGRAIAIYLLLMMVHL